MKQWQKSLMKDLTMKERGEKQLETKALNAGRRKGIFSPVVTVSRKTIRRW